jgi:hypothetical protein
MTDPTEQFKISLNQNLWGLVIGFSALGAAEHFHLPALFWFATIVSAVMLASTAVTTLAYTIKYWKTKFRE